MKGLKESTRLRTCGDKERSARRITVNGIDVVATEGKIDLRHVSYDDNKRV